MKPPIIGYLSPKSRGGSSIWKIMGLLSSLTISMIRKNSKNMLIESGPWWRNSRWAGSKEMTQIPRFISKTTHICHSEGLFTMWGTHKFNGISEKDANPFFRNYGMPMMLSHPLMGFALWTGLLNIRNFHTTTHCIPTSPQTKTISGAIKGLWLSLMPVKTKEDLFVSLKHIITIISTFRKKAPIISPATSLWFQQKTS